MTAAEGVAPRRLRLLMVAETYPPDYGGGASAYVRDFCRILAARGHDVRVLCAEWKAGEAYSRREEPDGPVIVERVTLPAFLRHDPEGRLSGLRRWRAHEREVAAIVADVVGGWRPELVQYNTNRPFGEAPLFALARAGIPIVYVFHEAWLICARLMLLRSPGREQCDGPSLVRCTECVYSHYDLSHARALAKLPWRFARFGVTPLYRYLRRRRARGLIHAGLAYSEFMARVHSPHLSAPVHHVPFGINLDGLPARPALRRHRPLRFGFVGGLQDTKGIGDVLTATAELAAKGHDFEVHVWGPGVERRGEHPASKEPTGRVVFRSMYGLGELWDVYSQMDVALMATTVREPFGRVPLEAAAMGVPAIAPAVGGIVETIRHDVDGLLYAFGDAGDLGRQMGRLLDEPGLLERLAANLRAPLDTRTQVPVVESLYLRLLEPGAEETAPPRRRS